MLALVEFNGTLLEFGFFIKSIPAKIERTVTDIREGSSRVVNITWKTNTSISYEVSNNGKHGNTSVLDFYKSKTIEFVLVTIGNKTKWVKETKRRLCTKFILECHVGGNRVACGILCRCEGGCGGNEGGEDSKLHLN